MELKNPYGEVFTPDPIVEQMLNMLDVSAWTDPNVLFIESSCGDGAFVLPIIQRRYKATGDLIGSLCSVFGWDIQKKNVDACRERILRFCFEVTQDQETIYRCMAIMNHHISRRDSLNNSTIPSTFLELSVDEQARRVKHFKDRNPWEEIKEFFVQ
jgi:SAM-dependent methyltransferase